jgi:hypothetical protein
MVHPIKYACIRLLVYISVSMLYSDDAFLKVQVGTKYKLRSSLSLFDVLSAILLSKNFLD